MKKNTLWLSFMFLIFMTTTNAQQDFESATIGALPSGWTSSQTESDDPGFSVQNTAGYAHGGSQYLAHIGANISTESTSWVVSSAQTINNNYELKFYWRGKWSTSYNYTAVYVSTTSNDPVANPSDFTLLEELSPANYPNTWLQWNEAAYDLSAYSGQVYVAFKYVGDHAHDFFIDDMSVDAIPYCDLPDNLTVNNRYLDSLDISWDAVAGYENYEVVWGAPGFDPNTAGITPTQVTGATYTITGLTSSTQYDIYVRTACSSYNYSSWIGPKESFTSGPPPANDDCDNAIVLTVNPDLNCGVVTSGTNLDATASSQADDVTGTPNNDVWFSFVATNTRHFIFLSNVVAVIGTSVDMGMGLYDGTAGCSSLTFVDDSDPNTFDANGLTVGTTYFLRVYGWYSTIDSAQTFDVCVGTPPPAPANDLCSGAVNLTVYPEGGSSGNELSASTLIATDSGVATTCDTYGTNLDLFYSFTVPAGETGIAVYTGGTKGSDVKVAVFDACGGVELECMGSSNTHFITGLTGGTTYILKTWLDDWNTGDFTIALESIPPAPANDLCSGAIPLTVYNSLQTITGNNTSATDSGIADPGCGSYDGGDIWYSVVVPTDGNVTLETAAVGTAISDTGMAVYSGTCGSLTLITCNDDGGAGYFSQVEVTGATPGETLYVRVWEYGNNSFGDIGIGAWNNSMSVSNNQIDGFNYYPNPITNSSLNMNAKNDIQNVMIFDLTGKEVINISPNTMNTTVDMSQLNAGIYFVKVRINDQLTAFKIVKH